MAVQVAALPSLGRLGRHRKLSFSREKLSDFPQVKSALSSSRQDPHPPQLPRLSSLCVFLCSVSRPHSFRLPPQPPACRLSSSFFSSSASLSSSPSFASSRFFFSAAVPRFVPRTDTGPLLLSSSPPFSSQPTVPLSSHFSRPFFSSSSLSPSLPSFSSCSSFSESSSSPVHPVHARGFYPTTSLCPPRSLVSSRPPLASSSLSPSVPSSSLSLSLPSSFLSASPSLLTFYRTKMVKSASYRRPSRASPTGQARKPHIGVRRLAAEYVWPGVVLVKQRKVIAFNVETKRRNRHFKLYPGENVKVSKVTNLVALCHGRVKFTHDVSRDVLVVNVLPERREELLREDLWRYRTEHVRSMEENRHICFLRRKAVRMFGKELVNPPTKPPLRPFYFTKRDMWENPALPDVPQLDDDM
ncbi:UNVERIFIED_CONTAM: hypothetical protein HHA_263110 [Hammondia hammondi]|eukprot:XP_008882807.1 hypothetical protein HHA_263110 [Hammondia hammondi]